MAFPEKGRRLQHRSGLVQQPPVAPPRPDRQRAGHRAARAGATGRKLGRRLRPPDARMDRAGALPVV